MARIMIVQAKVIMVIV